MTSADLGRALRCERFHDEWRSVEHELATFRISETAGGVNPGDRRAIYYLVRHFEPRAVLEIGTHIGASTVHIAAALRKAQQEVPTGTYRLTTVDIADVNDPVTRPWVHHGSACSPAEMIERLRFGTPTSFLTTRSLDHFASTGEQYDFIFLDGGHAALTVYSEIPGALRVLRPGGVVLLHDFFPELQPLWADGAVIKGPWLATERLRSEGARFEVLPLGELPWPTKLNSHRTSLALLIGT